MHLRAESITIAIGVTGQTHVNLIYGLSGATLRAVLPTLQR